MSESSDITMTLLEVLKRFMSMAEERAKTLLYGITLIEALSSVREVEIPHEAKNVYQAS